MPELEVTSVEKVYRCYASRPIYFDIGISPGQTHDANDCFLARFLAKVKGKIINECK